MTRTMRITPAFVEYIPNELEEGTLYVSMAFATATHKCCCGCGNEVVTPLSPTDWRLEFDGESISLHPSIGNWSFECRSHYWIQRNIVQWAPRWSEKQVDAARSRDRLAKERYFQAGQVPTGIGSTEDRGFLVQIGSGARLWQRVARWWRRR